MIYPERHGVSEIIEYLGGHPQRPKVEIAQAVAEYGVPIPRLFEGLDNAISSGVAFVARSEHPAELYYSGLCSSVKIDPGDEDTERTHEWLDELRIQQAALDDPNRSYDSLTARDIPGRRGYIDAEWWRYLAEPDAGLHSDSTEAFARDHALSYWQMEQGYNRYMIEDSGRPGRYYVGTMRNGLGEPFDRADRSVEIIENGDVVHSYYAHRDREAAAQVPDPDKLITFYETVRSLPVFDPANAPIIEFVDRPDEPPIFLQYLPTQPVASRSTAEITPPDTGSAIHHVRGTTCSQTVEFTLRTSPPEHRGPVIDQGFTPSALSNYSGGDSTGEYYFPQAVVYLGYGTNEDRDLGVGRFINASIDHGTRSSLFKPPVSLVVEEDCLARLKEIGRYQQRGQLEAALVSDGETARLQYYDPREKKIIEI